METKIYYATGKRVAYNRLLKHMIVTTTIVDRFEKGENLADILNGMVDSGSLNQDQLPALLNIILVSRAKLPYRSMNLPDQFSSHGPMISQFTKWNALDLVVAFHHPTVGLVMVNPARIEHWQRVHELKKDELIVVYARAKQGGVETARKGLDAFFALLAGKAPVEDAAFSMAVAAPPAPSRVVAPAPVAAPPAAAQVAAPVQPAAPAPAPVAPAGPVRGMQMTPKYSVQVTNELFHNGNVEAWKNIIEAYHAKYTGCRVIVYHEGELIQDLNSLFKWGKVKHGGVIMFQVSGAEIKGVSRLQRYLYEGASSRFEAFLKKDINKVLNLF